MAYAQRHVSVAGGVDHETRSAAGSQLSLQHSYLSPLVEEGWVLFSGSSNLGSDEVYKHGSREGSSCASSDLMAALQDNVAFPSHDGLGSFSASTESESTHARIHAWRVEQSKHLRDEIQRLSASEVSTHKDVDKAWIERFLQRVFGLDHEMLQIVFGEKFVDGQEEQKGDAQAANQTGDTHDEAYWEKQIDLSVIWSYVKSRFTRSETPRLVAKSRSASRCGAYGRGRVSKRNYWDDGATSVSSMGGNPMGEWGSI